MSSHKSKAIIYSYNIISIDANNGYLLTSLIGVKKIQTPKTLDKHSENQVDICKNRMNAKEITN